ncbi:MAG: hypothetical protein AAFR21_13890 [Pseudomonadota bacterium]
MKIEAMFGGLLALAVVAVAVIAMFSLEPSGGSYGGSDRDFAGSKFDKIEADLDKVLLAEQASFPDKTCQCFEAARNIAYEGVPANSSRYRTGYTQCSALVADGGDAWTAGWNAAVGGKAARATCRQYLRSRN